MGCKAKILILLSLSGILFSSLANAENAHIKEVRFIKGGELKSKDRVEDIRIFVQLKGSDGSSILTGKDVKTNDIIYVEPGANLLVRYNKQEGWIGNNTRVKIEKEGVKVVSGEIYVNNGGGWFNTGKLALLGYSEYYVKVDEDGKTTLYVVKGEVYAKDKDTGEQKLVSSSMAINESLEKIDLSKDEIKRILIWRDLLKFRMNMFWNTTRWVRGNLPVMAVGATVGVIIKEAFFSSDIKVIIDW